MPLYPEQGIVLRTMRLGEADRIVSIYTQGSGKLRAVAKGVRKTKSRFGGRLEPFTHVDLLLYKGRDLDIVTQCEVLTSFRHIREDYLCFTAGEAILDATDRVSEDRERNVRQFMLLLGALRALSSGEGGRLAPYRRAPRRRGRRRARCRRRSRAGDRVPDGLRVLDGELAPPAVRGPLPAQRHRTLRPAPARRVSREGCADAVDRQEGTPDPEAHP